MKGKWEGGKGSTQRPGNKSKFDENWERIFGKPHKETIKQNPKPNK